MDSFHPISVIRWARTPGTSAAHLRHKNRLDERADFLFPDGSENAAELPRRTEWITVALGGNKPHSTVVRMLTRTVTMTMSAAAIAYQGYHVTAAVSVR